MHINNNGSDRQIYYLHFMDKLHHWGGRSGNFIFIFYCQFSFEASNRILIFLALMLFTYCDLTSRYKVSHIPTMHFIQLLLELLFRKIYLQINISLIVPFPEVLKKLLFWNRIWFCYSLPSLIVVQCTAANLTGGISSFYHVAMVTIICGHFQERWKYINCIIKR